MRDIARRVRDIEPFLAVEVAERAEQPLERLVVGADRHEDHSTLPA